MPRILMWLVVCTVRYSKLNGFGMGFDARVLLLLRMWVCVEQRKYNMYSSDTLNIG